MRHPRVLIEVEVGSEERGVIATEIGYWDERCRCGTTVR